MKNMTTCTIVMFLLILSTAYALWLYNNVFSGLLNKNIYFLSIESIGVLFKNVLLERHFLLNYSDISVREVSSLTYLLVPVFFLGLNPSPLLKVVEMDFSKILNSYS
ncbi:MAG: hypothetical protein CMP47_12120 [Rickettsiales bacterium]|nr:hypothetical protein [Rickettsiales bacterium]